MIELVALLYLDYNLAGVVTGESTVPIAFQKRTPALKADVKSTRTVAEVESANAISSKIRRAALRVRYAQEFEIPLVQTVAKIFQKNFGRTACRSYAGRFEPFNPWAERVAFCVVFCVAKIFRAKFDDFCFLKKMNNTSRLC